MVSVNRYKRLGVLGWALSFGAILLLYATITATVLGPVPRGVMAFGSTSILTLLAFVAGLAGTVLYLVGRFR